MSFGKSSSKSNQQQQQQQTQTQAQTEAQTQTPNNLGALQTGWNMAGSLVDPSNPAVNSAVALTTNAANNTANAANGGLTTATNFANGGAVNGANGYLTPFANGSMTGNLNPYFQNMVDQLSRSLQPQADGAFGAAGRYGSGANANAFNSALTNQAGQLGYANFNDSLNRQISAADQLSTNNSNSNNQALAALGLIPGLGTAATGAGAAAFGAAAAPASTYADILALLGSGGGTSTGNASGTGSGNSSGSGSGSSTTSGFTIAPKFSLGPFSFGG